MSDTIKTSYAKFIETHAKSIRYWAGLFATYFGMKASTLITLAATKYNPDPRTSGDAAGANTFADIFFGFLAPTQDFATVILIIAAVICGMKIGASAVTSDPRSRTNSIVGLFFIIVGEVVVLHAQALVGMATHISVNNS
ncbi:Uncharacterized protein JF73_17700 (plasmid) [Lactobacillus helsingborgensis]|uniref:Uncharacterized protein n=2 Tax=Lactobacillus TaxID=1578 RepID=A0AA47GHU9_9LACO|nr:MULTISPECIES: hypothetical protein [Lactobacillus]KJY54755.1 Uncharacterized protein JF74_19360 [Lactobacillus melliventris]KJY60592.1 Uncharacterized protein JF73_17700 [Lactobacillus helsingborgensis]UZX30637.1 hypothetical protein LDX53_09125 [Lactobacillus helsingborgensis]UZX32432.1 hypothetical protein LDX52_09680 [Lactobacillus helsingborgensis]